MKALTVEQVAGLPEEAKQLLASEECVMDRMTIGSAAIMQREDGTWGVSPPEGGI